MSIDLTPLNNLKKSSSTGKKEPHRTPGEQLLTEETARNMPKTETSLDRLTGENKGIAKLQREADRKLSEKEQAIAVYREYQQNIKLSEQLQTEILKGSEQGENIKILFLKAVKAISLMTGNNYFYSQLQKYTDE